jgi:hypothetical protein
VIVLADLPFAKPSIEYSTLYPLLIVFGAALVGVLVEAFAPRASRYVLQLFVTFGGLVAALVGTILVARDLPDHPGAVSAIGKITAVGAISADGPSSARCCSPSAVSTADSRRSPVRLLRCRAPKQSGRPTREG